MEKSVKVKRKKKAPAESGGAIGMVSRRNLFYRSNYRRVMTALLGLVVINIITLMVLSWKITHPNKPTYFATSSAGNVIPLVPLNQPLVGRQALLDWATEAATAAFSYDFVNWRSQLQDAAVYFTDDGWHNFLVGLNSSAILNTVQATQLAVTATPSNNPKPTILTQGMIGGVYAWRVQIPLTVSFRSSSETKIETVLVNLLIKRVSTLQYPLGLGVVQYASIQQSTPVTVESPPI